MCVVQKCVCLSLLKTWLVLRRPCAMRAFDVSFELLLKKTCINNAPKFCNYIVLICIETINHFKCRCLIDIGVFKLDCVNVDCLYYCMLTLKRKVPGLSRDSGLELFRCVFGCLAYVTIKGSKCLGIGLLL